MQAHFRPNGVHLTVLADGCGVICRFAIRQDTPVAERIFAIRIDIFGIEGQGEILFEFDIHSHIGISQGKGAKSHFSAHMDALVLFEIRLAGSEIDVSRRTELPRRLKNIGFLTIKELYFLHIIQRVTAQVHLSVLGISQLYSVVIHRGMLASHRADIDGLDSPHSAVVFYLHA